MFKTKFRSIVLLLVLVLLALSATAALADGPPYPAVVADPAVPCQLLAADGTVFITGDVVGKVVATSPKSGKVKFVCHADHPINVPLPDQTVHFDFDNTGGSCSVGPGMETTDWRSTVTPGGKVTMVCNYPG